MLAEIGAPLPEVSLAASIPAAAERVDLASWGLSLYEGSGHDGGQAPGSDLEHLAVARIARDRIERRFDLER